MSLLSKEGDSVVDPLHFKKVEGLKCLEAEFAVTNGDLVFHFFRTDKVSAKAWDEKFPELLDQVVPEWFSDSFPRLQAARVNEADIDSYWLRAFGHSRKGMPAENATKLIQKMDEELFKSLSVSRSSTP